MQVKAEDIIGRLARENAELLQRAVIAEAQLDALMTESKTTEQGESDE